MVKIWDYLWRYKTRTYLSAEQAGVNQSRTYTNFMRNILLLILVLLILPISTFAHCPLCTAGAGIGALIAKELGMKSSAIGVWMGAFSVALGWWLGDMIISRLNARDSARSMRQSGLRLRFGSDILPLPTRISLAEIARLFLNHHLFFKSLSILISFLSIILPLKLYFYEIGSFSIFWFGEYGSLFNRTYVYDKFLFGSIIGGLILLTSPLISKKIIELRQGRIFPYQGLLITFILLIIISVLFQIKI